MKRHECDLIKLQMFLDKELSKEETERLKIHLENCSYCQDKIFVLKKTETFFKKLSSVSVPENFTEKVMNGLHILEKAKPNLIWQLLITFILIAGIVLTFIISTNLYPIKELTGFIILQAYFVVKFLFAFIRDFFFHPLVINLSYICCRTVLDLFLQYFLPMIKNIIFYEVVMLFSIFIFWNWSKLEVHKTIRRV